MVTLTNGFWMGHHPVTQGEYQTVMGANPSYFTGDLSRPVETVTWLNASNFCSTLTQREQSVGRLPAGWVYRLPTEAEWEYCCRALTTSRLYYGNDPSYSSLTNYAWYSANSPTTTQPVGQKLANPWGLVDMAGNVWEWCQDWYTNSYAGGSLTNPQGPISGSSRMIRGASWGNVAADCRSARRFYNNPSTAYNSIGFRVVLAPQ
jgi:formylglycine-generating enzyme required for sulfatase activity